MGEEGDQLAPAERQQPESEEGQKPEVPGMHGRKWPTETHYFG